MPSRGANNGAGSCCTAMLIRRVKLVCCVFTLFVSSEGRFTIKRNNLGEFQDRFTVPKHLQPTSDSFCRQNYGASSFSASITDCLCPLENATFDYFNNMWTCYKNSALRTQQGECDEGKHRVYMHNDVHEMFRAREERCKKRCKRIDQHSQI